MTIKDPEFAGFSGLLRSIIKRKKKSDEVITKSEAELPKDEPAIPQESCMAIFGYAIILPDENDDTKEIVVIGNFMIKNIGKETLHHPMICIWIKPAGSARLGGKIVLPEIMIDAPTQEQWVHVHQDWKERVKNTGEYWLKPKHCDQIRPGETLVFSNFELVFHANKKNSPSFATEGFVYFKDVPEGVPSANTILIHL